MTKDPTLQEILVALSFALDLTEGAVPGHAIRCSLLGMRIALEAGVSRYDLPDLYHASLLKDVGCSSNSARFCAIVGGDDRAIKAGAKLSDWTKSIQDPATMKMLWKEVLPGAPAWRKAARLARMAITQQTNNRQVIEIRCDRGATIVRKLGLPNPVVLGVRHLDEHWDGGGYPDGLKKHDIPLISRLMLVAQHLDAFGMERGEQAAIDSLKERAGRWYDPSLVRAAQSLHKRDWLFQHCRASDPIEQAKAAILQAHPGGQTILSAPDIDNLCETFAWVVDAKSPFTFRHSVGVMDAAMAIGNTLGLSPQRMQVLRRAALLHDVGKLGISNTILDKPTRLTDEEFTLVKSHPRMSQEILGHIDAFQEIAVLAGEHHEKLDGSGYPNRLRAEDLSLESRLLAVADIYGALSEDRPYRAGLSPAQIQGIMDRDIPMKLDPVCYDALRSVMDDLAAANRTIQHIPDTSWSPEQGAYTDNYSEAYI
ncbi:HD-GYP domain-containing protein [Bryocella elongata]|uniref:HD-GYP domain-containing protein n=1 Tax=Bryocella elongata TaxID=863522 RepID=UPI00135BF531|nr:HD domain-containing protein [Bryocella elongata]